MPAPSPPDPTIEKRCPPSACQVMAACLPEKMSGMARPLASVHFSLLVVAEKGAGSTRTTGWPRQMGRHGPEPGRKDDRLDGEGDALGHVGGGRGDGDECHGQSGSRPPATDAHELATGTVGAAECRSAGSRH